MTVSEADHIRPYEKNRFYWQYKGKPVLLLGGSVEKRNDPAGTACASSPKLGTRSRKTQ